MGREQQAVSARVPQRVIVEYRMPLSVVVDLESDRVEAVLNLDEEIQCTQRVFDVTGTPLANLDPAIASRAIEIAQTNQWPSWT